MSHIKTFARLKPAQELYEDYEIGGKKTFSLRVPELLRDYGLQPANGRYPTISYDFQFDRVFDDAAGQEEVYNVAARDIVTGFLDGYNGTIFAYGQTGTGKTYTVEGSPLRYSDRGLAPRALTEIYKSLEQREEEDITLSISYLEIYQEVAYDLLSTTARGTSPVTVFPRVTVAEGSNGACTVRNLSVHLAPSEDVASALLLQGQANRKVAETPVNQRSSRSHAVFTLYLAARKRDRSSDIITRSKLHLVDLAGSERVAKTGVDGQQLTEAKSINLSLHYLESVIIALQADTASSNNNRPRSNASTNSRGNTSLGGRSWSTEGTRRHIPYRNSLLTMVLRDSLGGNCQTSMIATISLEVHNLGETLSTCRFAQRVACIANHARRNEEVDDKTLIQQLKRRVAELETQIACLKMSTQMGESGDGGRRGEEEEMTSKLTDEDKLTCAQVVQEYLAGRVSDPVVAGMTSPFKFRECLRILKRMVMSKYFQDKLTPPERGTTTGTDVSRPESNTVGNAAPRTHQKAAERDTGVQEGQGKAQIWSTDDAGESRPCDPPVTSGTMDTDDLILNIQRLYAASRREQQARQQAAAVQEHPGTPPTPKHGAARPDTYKSPYERKREKEIRRLSRRVETLKETQTLQQQQLQELRTSTTFGELSSMEGIIKNKIQVTREQLADQHAYLLHLRHTEATQDVLQQEQLVEDQLVKREAKFQKKLEEVQQKKADMEAQVMQGHSDPDNKDMGEGQGQVKGSAGKRSLEEQFSQYKKRNGTLNTRQVFDMLKSEEKKQIKVSHQTETEKRYLMTKQLALREEATREKLRELKEMMRRSREQALLGQHPSDPPVPHFPAFSAGHVPAVPPFGAWTDERDTHTNDSSNGQGFSETFVVEKPEEERQSLSLTLQDLDSGKAAGDERNGLPPRTEGAKTGWGQGGGSHSSSRADLKWESAYSRPSTSHSQRSQEWAEPLQNGAMPNGGGGVYNSLTSVPSPELTKGEREGTTSNSSDVKSTSPDMGLSLWQGKSPELVGRDQNRHDVDAQKIEQVYEQAGMVDRHGQDNRADTHSVQDAEHVSGKGFEDLVKSSSPTVMPSEYVHGMNSRDKFDARKMGLSANTFDSALSSMLNDESRSVSYGFQFYDRYARESKPPARGKGTVSSRSPERHRTSTSHRGVEQRTTPYAVVDVPKDHTGTFGSAWGPEVKNSSVAKRLAQFLAEDKSSRTRPRTDTTASTRTTKSVSFLERLTQLQDEEQTTPDTDPEVTSPRIQALKDAQRESTYMGRVQAEKERVAKIRQARQAAEAIQRAWRRHCRNAK
ncbi:uncharacterized protein LOC143287006 [Babylonia areolata]|uniref:uncharacterized protein LOC143287006 n=1 Tax=Babylonia areolata TaxID=304850 RepID=UPI003FD0E41D